MREGSLHLREFKMGGEERRIYPREETATEFIGVYRKRIKDAKELNIPT